MAPKPNARHIAAAAILGCLAVAAITLVLWYIYRKRVPAARKNVVSVALSNGLGNQLFQMAAAFGVAAQTSRTLVIHAPSVASCRHTSERYADSIFKEWPQVQDKVDKTHAEVSTECFLYKPIPSAGERHLQLNGYFQNEQYFKHCFAAFSRMLRFPDNLPLLQRTCFVHLRFGDYVGTVHGVELVQHYLPRAMLLQRAATPQVQFLVFSDNIARCKTIPLLQAADVAFSAEKNEVRALVRMSRCWIGGICSNSTFSWWGAYLNPNPARVVTFPRKWMNNSWPVDIQFAGSHVLSVEEQSS